jgi:hypothetical protein
MWLCAMHRTEVDRGVTVYEIGCVGACGDEMNHDALFYALVRAELKRLANGNGPPDPERWDRQRARHLPLAWQVSELTGKSWDEMVQEVTFVKGERQ